MASKVEKFSIYFKLLNLKINSVQLLLRETSFFMLAKKAIAYEFVLCEGLSFDLKRNFLNHLNSDGAYFEFCIIRMNVLSTIKEISQTEPSEII